MKKYRFILTLWLALSIASCSVLPDISIPPGWTVTPSQSPTPEATSTPTLIPTPVISARVNAGDHDLFNGDYESALLDYQIVLQDSPDALLRASAKWGEARIYFEGKRYNETLTALQNLITEYPDSPYLARAYFLQGFVHYRLENYAAAADSWQTYLVLQPGVLDAYVQELRGDALYNASNYAEALSAYSAALQAPALGDGLEVDFKVAGTQTQLGDYETAMRLYEGITARAPNDYIKAEAAYETGRLYQLQGKNDAAAEKFQLAVENYPLSYYAYLSLIALLDSGISVSELDRGLVDFFAGQYDVAIAAFTRYLESNPVDMDGTAYYYRAQAKRNLSLYDEALEDYALFLKGYPLHPGWGDAWGEKAYIEWTEKGDYSTAAETLLEFVNAAPNTGLAVEYLMSAARIYERDGQYDQAVETWARVANEFPGSQQAPDAIFLMGIIYYRQGEMQSALEAFSRSFAFSQTKSGQARAQVWIGKTQQQLGNLDEVLIAWRTAQNLDSGGYYSERARDLLAERAPFTPAYSPNLTTDLSAERKAADSWVRLTFNLPPETDLNGLGPLATDSRILRGHEFWEVGLKENARREFENLRLELEGSQDAVNSYRLANYLVDIGLYRSAVFSARQVLTIAGLEEHSDSMMAPSYFSRIRYGLYYSDIIIPESQKYGFDPLLVFSVIRQESLFEGFVNSSAGAYGLMQIIPSTGAQIASELGTVNYSEQDLYRPVINVQYGTYYLAKNYQLLNQDLYAALAAYNGGPGNSLVWKALAGDDPDLFLETVRFEETRNYIRNIYEIHTVYRRLYSAAE